MFLTNHSFLEFNVTRVYRCSINLKANNGAESNLIFIGIDMCYIRGMDSRRQLQHKGTDFISSVWEEVLSRFK